MDLDKLISMLKKPRYYKNKIILGNLAKHIKKKFYFVKGSKILYVHLPYWNGKIYQLKLLKRYLLKKKCSFLAYDFPSSILSSNHKLTRQFFLKLDEIVRKDIKKIYKKFDKIVVVSSSLGCVNALMVANNFPLVREVILVAPGNCLAESLWKGLRTRYLKEEFENKGIKLKQLKKYWFRLAPENNLKLKNVKVHVFLSKSDKIIPYSCGKKLVNVMKKNKVDVNLKENCYGHYMTVLKFYMLPENFIS
jgi:esterase/lipase